MPNLKPEFVSDIASFYEVSPEDVQATYGAMTDKQIADALSADGIGDVATGYGGSFYKRGVSGKLKKLAPQPGLVETARDVGSKLYDTQTDAIMTANKAGAGLLSSIGAIPGQFTGDYDNAVTRAADAWRDAARAGETDFLKSQEADKAEALAASDDTSTWGQVKASAGALVDNPATLAEPLGTTLAFISPIKGVAAGAGLLAKGLRGSEKAIALAKGGAALLAGSGMQGSSVGKEVYDEIKALPREVLQQNYEWMQMVVNQNMDPDEATLQLSEKYARSAGNKSAAIAMFFQLLAPGIESSAAGVRIPGIVSTLAKPVRQKLGSIPGVAAAGSRLRSAADAARLGKIGVVAGKESLEQVGELGEELGGQAMGNLGVGNVDATKRWNEGFGETIVSTAMSTPAMSLPGSINEGFGLDVGGPKKKSKAAGTPAGTTPGAGTGNAEKDGTFPRTRNGRGSRPSTPADTQPVVDVPADAVPPEQSAVPEPPVPAVEPAPAVPADLQAQPAEAPVTHPAPPAEGPIASAVTPVAPEVEAPVAPEPELPVTDPLPGVDDATLLKGIGRLTKGEVEALLQTRPDDARMTGSARTLRSRVRNQLDRHLRDLTADRDPAGDRKAKSTASRDISEGKRRIKELLEDGNEERAKVWIERLKPIYDAFYGKEDGPIEYQSDMDGITRKANEKAKAKAERASKTRAKVAPAPAEAKAPVASLPDAQARVTNFTNAIANSAKQGIEAFDATVATYMDGLRKAAVALYPEGNKAEEYIQEAINKLRPQAEPVAAKPVRGKKARVPSPIGEVVPEPATAPPVEVAPEPVPAEVPNGLQEEQGRQGEVTPSATKDDYIDLVSQAAVNGELGDVMSKMNAGILKRFATRDRSEESVGSFKAIAEDMGLPADHPVVVAGIEILTPKVRPKTAVQEAPVDPAEAYLAEADKQISEAFDGEMPADVAAEVAAEEAAVVEPAPIKMRLKKPKATKAPKVEAAAKPKREKKAKGDTPKKKERPVRSIDDIANDINTALSALAETLDDPDQALNMEVARDEINNILDTDLNGKIMMDWISKLINVATTQYNKEVKYNEDGEVIEPKKTSKEEVSRKIRGAIGKFVNQLGNAQHSAPEPDVSEASPKVRKAIALSNGKIKIRMRPGSQAIVTHTVDGNTVTNKLDLSDTNPDAESSWGMWGDILSVPSLTAQVVTALTALGDAGQPTLDKLMEAADLLLDEDGLVDPEMQRQIEETLEAGAGAKISRRVRSMGGDDPHIRLLTDMISSRRQQVIAATMTPDDVTLIQSILSQNASRDEKVVQLNEASALIGIALIGGAIGIGTVAYKAGRRAAKAIKKGYDLAKELAKSDMYKAAMTYALPPEMVVQNWARALLKDPKKTPEQKAAIRALLNKQGQFLDSVRRNQTELYNLFRDSVVSADLRDEYAPKYKEWVEQKSASTSDKSFTDMPKEVQKAFINFKAISDKLAEYLKANGGSPRENWVWRIANQDRMRDLKSLAVRAADLAKAVNGNTGAIDAVKDIRGNTVKAANSVPDASALGKAIKSAVSNPTDGLIHGFINANGELVGNIDALPGYLRHEQIVSKDDEAPEPLFPALMDYKSEPMADGNIKYTPIIKDLSKRDPAEVETLVRAEAMRVIAEMFDHDYGGGRVSNFISKKARNRNYKTDGSLVNGREMPYLGDEFYVTDPWQAMPQIINRQVRGLARWEHFGRQREKLNQIIHKIGPVGKQDSKGFDESMGIRFPKNGSQNLEWSQGERDGTIAGALDDIAMGYYSSAPLIGKDEAVSYANPDGTYSFGNRSAEVIRNAVTKKNVDAAVNAIESVAITGMLRMQPLSGAVNEFGAAAGAGMFGLMYDYSKKRLKYAASKDAIEKAVAAGKTDASYRVPSTKMEAAANNASSWFGTFDGSTERMDASARDVGVAAFHEALGRYADARDIGWDDNATSHKTEMMRSKILREDMELLYSPEELDHAIKLFDSPSPANDVELDEIALRFARELSKSVSGVSDNSAKSGMNRQWWFKRSAGFLAGVTMAMQLQHLNDMLRSGNLVGRTRRERISGYLKGAVIGGLMMNVARASPLGASIWSALMTRNLKALAVMGAVAAGIYSTGHTPYLTYGKKTAELKLARGAQIANDLDVKAGIGWLTTAALEGMPFAPRLESFGLSMGSAITPMDKELAKVPDYETRGIDLTSIVPAIGYPYKAVKTVARGGMDVLRGLGEYALDTDSPTGATRMLRGGLRIMTIGDILSKPIGNLNNYGEPIVGGVDRLNTKIGKAEDGYTEGAPEIGMRDKRNLIPE